MKNLITIILFSFSILFLYGQNLKGIPQGLSKTIDFDSTSTPTVDEIYDAYFAISPEVNDTANPEYKKASRWMRYNFSKYNIKDSVTYSLDTYTNAFKAIYNSPLGCNNSDLADWTSDGPFKLPDFSIGFLSPRYQQMGGWINSIYNHPNDLTHILIGTHTSGIFLTTDMGVNWTNVTDHLPFPVLGVNQLISAPNNPDFILGTTGTWYIDGSLIYSTNGGVDWQVVQQNMPTFNWIDFHPSIDGLVIAAGDEEIWLSEDYGINWTQMANTPVLDDHWEFVKVLITDNTILLTSDYIFGFGFDLYKGELSGSSNNYEINWTSIYNDFPEAQNATFIDFSNKVDNRFYIQFANSTGGHFYKTLDGGETINYLFSNSGYKGQRDKNELVASINDPNVFYWGSVLQMRRINETTGTGPQILGTTLNNGHHDDYRCSHILNDAGKDRILFGNDGGPALVEDGLITSPEISTLNGNLSVNLMHAFHVHEPSKRIAYAFQDHSMIYRDGGVNNPVYSDHFIWEGAAAMIQDQFKDGIVGEAAFGFNQGNSIFDIDNSTNPIVQSNFAQNRLRLGGYFITYRHHPERFARGLVPGNSIQNGGVALNRGKMDSDISEIETSRSIGAVAICERHPEVIYAAEFTPRKALLEDDSKLYVSTDDGISWTGLNNATITFESAPHIGTFSLSGQLAYNGIRALAVDHFDPKVVYCGIGRTHGDQIGSGDTPIDERFRVIKSEDFGETFEDYSEGLPALPVERLLTVESDIQLMFCATSVGVYYRTNEMDRWECFSQNLPKAEITGMQFDYCSNELYVSTYGRGMWKTPVPFDVRSSYTEEIATNTLWDEDKVVKEHVTVKSGATLTITATINVGYDKKITVEPGGKLVLDGGTLTNYCNDFWQGIEVHGNRNLFQSSANQGVVEIRNGGTIEFARNGIRTIESTENGYNWNKTGGIIRVLDGKFKDCRRGIEFMSYQNTLPSGIELKNVSVIRNAEFITTDDYLNGSPYAGITMYDVNGVTIRNSIFENQRTNLAAIINGHRGSGIISVDANYRATSNYNIFNGQPIVGTGNEFKNLFYGVMTYGGTGRSDVIINDNLFEECIFGVGLMGSNYGIIGRNEFNLLIFNNSGNAGYGVYTDGAYGFNIEGNTFSTVSASNVNHHATNVRNSSTNASSGKVYRNTINNAYIGTQTIGKNSTLKIDCNTYNKGKSSSVDVHHANGVLGDQGDCGALFGIPANNMFDGPCNNNNLAHIFKNPVATDFLYNYQESTLNPSCHNIGVNAIQCLTGDLNQCPDELANDILVEKPIRIKNWKTKLNVTKEQLEEVYDILASGDAEELITSIENDSPGDTKEALLAASPYLSDRVLIAYLTQDPTPPVGHINEVLQANSPLTDTVMSILNMMSLPNGIQNEINNVQEGVSERRILEGSESVLNTNRLIYVDAIVQEYLDTNWIDSAALFLEQEGSLEALCALVPIEVRRRDTTRANTIIDALRNIATEMEDNEPGCTRSCELNEYCDFQQSVFRIALREGGYFSITPEERTALELMASSDARIAVNAAAILHFLDEILPEYEGEELVFPKSMVTKEEVDELLKNSTNDLFSVHPNPTSGNTVFTIELDDIDGLSLIITDLNGRVVKILDVPNKEIIQHLELQTNGVYLVHLTSKDTILSTKRLIYAK